jgi:7-cyano-7-deazaguanine synthase in queuosine biosynthesis
VHLRIDHISKKLGQSLPAVVVDLLELAAYIYVADQAVSRGGVKAFEYGQRWRRHFRFEVPVRCPDVWRSPRVNEALVQVLSDLSDDDYEFGFARYKNPPRLERYLFDEIEARPESHGYREVLLFSGGLDSLGGAVQEILQAQNKVALVSHRPANNVYRRQCDLVEALRARLGGRRLDPLHVAVEVNKGRIFDRDYTQRSRSFLFAAVAAAVARLFELNRIRFYENGVTSLNLPLSPHVLGGRASRTTHPRVLAGFQRLFSLLFGVKFQVDNPFQPKTKAEILKGILAAGAGKLCALACSCSRTRQGTTTHPHCGRCSQCVDRRLTALAAGLSDDEDPPGQYACDVLTEPREDAELTLVERYVGTVHRVRRMAGPADLLLAYPEAARALPYLGDTPSAAVQEILALYRRHADQVFDAISAAVSREADHVARRDLPANCMLSIALGGRPSSAPAATPASEDARLTSRPESELVVDSETLTAHWGGHECFLGAGIEFRLLQRLHASVGKFVTLDILREDVWDDSCTEKNTIQRTVSNLRRRLHSDGLLGVEISGNEPGHYRLVVHPPDALVSA